MIQFLNLLDQIYMKQEKYDEAEELLETANADILEAHLSQTGLLQEYASGTEINVEIIMVHAQDHLMTTMTLREVALEMLALYRKVAQKGYGMKKEINNKLTLNSFKKALSDRFFGQQSFLNVSFNKKTYEEQKNIMTWTRRR